MQFDKNTIIISAVISFLIALFVFTVLLSVSGLLDNAEETNLLSCAVDADCTIKYNVLFRDYCSSGCFNPDAITDLQCNEKIRADRFIPETGCVCVNERCQITYPEEKDAKTCNVDGDCEISYNILYHGDCSSGCFGVNTSINPKCEERIEWQGFAPEVSCICIDGKCQESFKHQ